MSTSNSMIYIMFIIDLFFLQDDNVDDRRKKRREGGVKTHARTAHECEPRSILVFFSSGGLDTQTFL